MGAKVLAPIDLAIAAALVVLAGTISLLLGLGMHRRLAVAATRTVVQLLAVGYALAFIFAADTPWLVVGALLVMTVAAARASVKRSSRGYSGIYFESFGSLLMTGTLTTAVVTQVVIGVEPWYRAQYLIPLMGMVFGNSLTGISLCVDHLLSELDEHRDRIEASLAMGATGWEASRASLREAIRRSMIPIINAMSVAGLVSLPGMMTGQILAGADPKEAVAYQIVVMFMLAASTSMGGMVMALLVQRRMFNDKHQLLAHRIQRS